MDEQVVTQEETAVETQEPVEQAAGTEEQPPVTQQAPEPSELEVERKKREAAERYAAKEKKRADYAISQMDAYFRQQQQPAAAPAADPEPKEDAYGDNTLAYAKAWAAWNAREVVRQDNEKRQTESQQQVARSREEAFTQERMQRIAEAAQRDPQVWTACDTLGKMGVVIGTRLQDALHESENFEGLVKHLAANPQQVQRILSLSEVQQVKEIGILENELSKPASLPPPPLRTTQAPPPAKPLNGATAPTAAIDLNDPTLPVDVWSREHDRRERERAKKRGW